MAVLAWVAGAAAWPAGAAVPELLVVSDAGNPAHAAVVTAIESVLTRDADRKVVLRLRPLDDRAALIGASAKPPIAIVTVGTEAAQRVIEQQPPHPIFCVLIPEGAYHALAAGPSARRPGNLSGLLLDQPFGRQLRLIQLALPGVGQVGVVLGPDSRRHLPALRRAAAAVQLEVQAEIIDEERQLIGALRRIMELTDVVLAVPDALVFNRHTAQAVLQTAHGRGRPLIGYSHAYTRAGALFAAYSTPDQIGRHAGQSLLRFLETGRLPPVQAPRDYSVEVNERVARSLGVELPAERDLSDRLHATEPANEGAR